MLRWLTKLIRRQKPEPTPTEEPTTNGFTRAERNVFHFHDGTSDRAADPIEIQNAFVEHAGPDWPELLGVFKGAAFDLKLLDQPLPEGATEEEVTKYAESKKKTRHSHEKYVRDGMADLAEMVRKGFGVKPYNRLPDGTEEGLTVGELFDLLASFLAFTAKLAEDARLFQNSPGRTERESSAGASTTPSSSDSGSTDTR